MVKEITVDNEKIIPEAIDELETKHLQVWQKIKDNIVIYEIEEFNKHLSEMAFQNLCKIVAKYCNELSIGLQTFDVEIIEEKLHEFPELIENLKSLST